MSVLSLRFFLPLFIMLASVFTAGCATVRDPWFDRMVETGTVEPTSEVERQVLAQMDELPPDAPVTVAGKQVLAGLAYPAASGRTCRSLRIEGSRASLACRADGTADDEGAPQWFLAPDVFGPAPTETAPTAAAEAEAAAEAQGASEEATP